MWLRREFHGVTQVVELTTWLPAPPNSVWQHLQTSALLHHVAAPLIRFEPHDGAFPDRWHSGEYRADMLLFGLIPLGWQAIVIEQPEPLGDIRFLRDNGYGPLIKRWDHWIAIGTEEGGTRYLDQVTINAGPLTPVVAQFARAFYAYRQRRWRELAGTGFAALA